MSSASKSPKPKGKGRVCIFCEEGNVSEDTFGKLISRGGVTAHYFCMLFSSGLSQNGKSEKQGILGFLQADIIKEVKRGSRLKCSYCKKVGATIGCVVRNCKKMFHLGCGRKNDTLHQYFGTFSSFCPAHRHQQDVPSDDDPNIVCSICMNTVTAKPGNDTIRAPCCNKYWYHRECVQRYATSAGLYFFKCPLCNNKEEFQGEMLTMGIYIPDQDASWEKEPHAFQELLERYGICDAPECQCAEGRKYDKEGSKWEIILCDFCGSHGSHVACNHLEKLGRHDICRGCKEVDERTREEEYLLHSPPNKRKSLELLQLELASSPESTKGSSPYPGPSNAMKKVGLPKSPNNSVKQKSGAKKGKRTACTELKQDLPKPKRLKRSSKASATVTSASAKSRHSEVLSSSMSSQSSDDSSDEDFLISLNKTKLQKMTLENAWDVMRRRKLESGRKIAEKKKKNSKANRGTGGQEKDKSREATSVKFLTLVDSDTDDMFDDSRSNRARHRLIKDCKNDQNIEVKDRRLSLAVTRSEKEKQSDVQMKKGNSRLSLCAGTSAGSSKTKQKKLKQDSLESDKSQTTLTNWLKPKTNEEKSSVTNTISLSLLDQNLRRTPRKTSKKPVVVEWKGKQLLIKSPRVVLKRNNNQNVGTMKPKCLEIDMTDNKGGSNWNRDIDLLSNIESDIRVTRKMIDIDQIDAETHSEKEKQASGNVATASKDAKTKKLEKQVNNQNQDKFDCFEDTREAGNLDRKVETKTGTFNSVQHNIKVVKSESELDVHKTQHKMDSPAKNLRVKTGKNTTKIKSANQIQIADVSEGIKDKSSLKHEDSQSCYSNDSSPRGHRSQHKKQKRKDIVTTGNCFENGSETDNELTPLMQNEDCFNFTSLKGKSSVEKETMQCNKDFLLIEKKNSSEFGSLFITKVTLGSEKMESGDSEKTINENPVKTSKYRPTIFPDTPAKNLRKRSNQADVSEEASKQKVESDTDNCVNKDRLERLKNYKSKCMIFNDKADECSSFTNINARTSEKKEALKESHTFSVKPVQKQSNQMKKNPKLFWHFAGTRQVFNDNNNSVTDLCENRCENTCPNPQFEHQSAVKLANFAQDNVKPIQDRNFDYYSILGGEINELCDKVPTTVSKVYSGNELGNVMDSLSEDDQASHRNSLNGIKNNTGMKLRSSPRSLNKVLSTADGNLHMPDKMSVTEYYKANLDFDISKSSFSDKNFGDKSSSLSKVDQEAQRNIVNVIKNNPAQKLRSSPRSAKQISSPSNKNTHMSDRTLMAEYYGACIKSEPNEEVNEKVTLGNDGYHDDSDIIELPRLGNVMS